MGLFKALGKVMAAAFPSKEKTGRGRNDFVSFSGPSVGYEEIIRTSQFILEIAPEIVPNVVGRFKRQEIWNGNDGYAYLGEMRIGRAPMDGCPAEYWLVQDKDDPRNEWQIWYYISKNINGMPETSLSAVLDNRSPGESSQYLEFRVELGDEDLVRIENERKRRYFGL